MSVNRVARDSFTPESCNSFWVNAPRGSDIVYIALATITACAAYFCFKYGCLSITSDAQAVIPLFQFGALFTLISAALFIAAFGPPCQR